MESKNITENEAAFPWSLAEEVFDLLQERKANVIRFCDIDFENSWCGSKYRYLDEYIRFRTERVNIFSVCKGLAILAFLRWGGKLLFHQEISKFLFSRLNPPTVIIEHDADLLPDRTIEMMKRELKRGLISSCYFFVKHAQNENYYLDVETLQALEKVGFEIGYHQNAYERSNYDQELAYQLIASDLDWLQEHFNIRSFVPHGAQYSKNGLNNRHLPHAQRLKPLLWAYNGNCILKEYTWSDGGLKKRVRPPMDPREFVKKLANGSRAMMLMHPQYYGVCLRHDWMKLSISKEKWWRNLWDL